MRTAQPLAPEDTVEPDLTQSSLELIPGSAPGDWLVIGSLENQSESSLQEISILVSLVDGKGTPVASSTVSPALSNIATGELSPFIARFRDAPTATAASAAIESYTHGSAKRATLEIEIQDQFVIETGELALIGSIVNQEERPVMLSGIGLLAEDANSRPRALGEMLFGPSRLTVGEETFFLALAEANPGPVRWRIFHDGVLDETGGGPDLALVEGPTLNFTPQAAPFVIGSVRNEGTASITGSILLFLRSADRVISISELTLPVALAPGTELAFGAVEFPGFKLRSTAEDPASLLVEARLEVITSETPMAMLAIQVDTFHSVGSVLFIGGSVRNDRDRSVQAPVVLAEVRSSTGELLTAGWSELGEQLNPQQSTGFVVELLLVADLDIALSEIDLRATGTTAQP
jgi:hypothetical protein